MKERIQWKGYVISALIGIIITSCYNHFFDVKPSINDIKTSSTKILDTEKEIQSNIERIEEHYLQKDKEGIRCKIGYSKELKGKNVSVFKDNKLGLKSQDVIYITNPYGLFTPTVAFIVSTEDGYAGDSKADMFVSKEGLDKLDINKDQYKKGLFEVRMRYKDSNKQNSIQDRSK